LNWRNATGVAHQRRLAGLAFSADLNERSRVPRPRLHFDHWSVCRHALGLGGRRKDDL